MDRTFFELKEALQKPGCFLCRLEKEYTLRLLDGIFYEFVNDPQVRKTIAQKGFCREHARLLFSLRPSVLGMAIVYHDLLANYLNEHQEPSSCLVCEEWKEGYTRILRVLLTRWDELKSAWGGETFLCLRHLKDVSLEPLRPELEHLVDERLQGILKSLEGLIEKFDYRKSGLPISPREAHSWQNVMEFFAGSMFRSGKS